MYRHIDDSKGAQCASRVPKQFRQPFEDALRTLVALLATDTVISTALKRMQTHFRFRHELIGEAKLTEGQTRATELFHTLAPHLPQIWELPQSLYDEQDVAQLCCITESISRAQLWDLACTGISVRLQFQHEPAYNRCGGVLVVLEYWPSGCKARLVGDLRLEFSANDFKVSCYDHLKRGCPYYRIESDTLNVVYGDAVRRTNLLAYKQSNKPQPEQTNAQ